LWAGTVVAVTYGGEQSGVVQGLDVAATRRP
jgi:hypothetical protein